MVTAERPRVVDRHEVQQQAERRAQDRERHPLPQLVRHGRAAGLHRQQHLLGRISPISPPFFPVFCAFSPSRRGGSNEPQAGTQGQEMVVTCIASSTWPVNVPKTTLTQLRIEETTPSASNGIVHQVGCALSGGVRHSCRFRKVGLRYMCCGVRMSRSQ